MSPNQVGIIDIGIINILTGLHLGLEFFDHIAFLNQIMVDLDACDLKKCFGEYFALILVGS